MRPDQYEATKADRAGMIEQALDQAKNMTYFIQVPAPHNLLIRVDAKDDAHFIERLSSEVHLYPVCGLAEPSNCHISDKRTDITP